MRLKVHPLFLTGAFLLLFCAAPSVSAPLIISVILHESGHLVSAFALGKRVHAIELLPVGFTFGISGFSSYGEELITALSGPAANLAVCVACLPFREHGKADDIFMFSALFFVLNMLPIRSLDGGRALYCLTALAAGEKAALTVSRAAGDICLFLLWITALWVFFYSGANASLMIFCSYIFLFTVMKER